MIGFEPDVNIKIGGYTTIHHTPIKEGVRGMSPKEYELLCKRIVRDTSIVVLNIDKKYFTFDETFILVNAYTRGIPIVGVGEKVRDYLLNIVISNRFDFLGDAIIHIKNNY